MAGIVILFLIINSTPDLKFDFTATIVNELISKFRLPITIASLSIPLVAVVAALHRSTQTAQQIDTQQQQNSFANHFKHLEEFKKAFSGQENLASGWGTVELMHKDIYPESLQGIFEPIALRYDLALVFDELKNEVQTLGAHIPEKLQEMDLELSGHYRITHAIHTPSAFFDALKGINLAHSFSALYPEPIDPIDLSYYKEILDDAHSLIESYDRALSNKEFFYKSLSSNSSKEGLRNKFLNSISLPSDYLDRTIYWFFHEVLQTDQERKELLESMNTILVKEISELLSLNANEINMLEKKKLANFANQLQQENSQIEQNGT